MEITAVAEAITHALTPFMPLLTRIGAATADHATEEAGNRINAKGWALAKDVWARLHHRVADDPALRQAADDLAAVQADPAAQENLQHHLERMLREDPSLLRELDRLLTANPPPQQVNIASELNIGVQAGSILGGTVTGTGKQQPPYRRSSPNH